MWGFSAGSSRWGLSQRSALLTCEIKMGYPTKWGFSAGSSRWGLSQRSALLTCEIKMGNPACGALVRFQNQRMRPQRGGFCESAKLWSQRLALLVCEVKNRSFNGNLFYSKFRSDFSSSARCG